MLSRLLADAKAFGNKKACLETATFMWSAHRLHEGNGLVDRSPYEGAEVPAEFHARWRCMDRLPSSAARVDRRTAKSNMHMHTRNRLENISEKALSVCQAQSSCWKLLTM